MHIHKYKLDSNWQLYPFPGHMQPAHTPEELRASGVQPIPACVPGNVELDLIRAGLLPEDLFVGENIKQLRALETYEWWYETEFATPEGAADRQIELVFHGVDCIAVYWLNGKQLGSSDNMLIEHRFDTQTARLNPQPGAINKLAVRLQSPLRYAEQQEYTPSLAAQLTNWERLHVRKAGHNYGWDIMPRALSAGIWREVELIVHDETEIEEMYFYTREVAPGLERAEVGLFYQLRVADAALYYDGLEIRIAGVCGESSFEAKQYAVFKAGRVVLHVDRPRLWWPRGYGEPNLYELTVELLHRGRVLAVRRDTVGIRSAKLIRTDVTTPEQTGEFMLQLNHMPILAKGTNWVPLDVFHSRDAAKYEAALELVTDLGCNIVRCWGGNVYEDHAFFERCDRLGLMVWQDFALACELPPQTEAFHAKIREEAASVIRKLRQHPSLVLWCGDNECDDAYRWHGFPDPAANRITRQILPEAVREHDPYRDFLPSSPYWSPRAVASGDEQLLPERHLWGPRNYFRSRYYESSQHHFISEIGFQGVPNRSSLEKFLQPDYLWPWRDNPQWTTHSTEMLGADGPYAYRVGLIAGEIAEMFGSIPEQLDDFILGSQIQQAEAMKYFIESCRLRKWRQTGIIWWNVLDGWPQFSDAVVDYYQGKKLAYPYIRRVQQPVCLMIDNPERWDVRLVAGNDSAAPASGSYRVWDADSGETLLSGEYHTRANENQELGAIRIPFGEHRMLLIEWTWEGRKYGNHYLHGYPTFSLETYKRWLAGIAALDRSFDPNRVGK